MKTNHIYKAGVYLRLSREDILVSNGYKAESNSIANQRTYINAFLEKQEDIIVYDYYIDDGFSGVQFDRPNFERLIQDVNSNVINCVIVKDISRFGREYVTTGNYVEKIFPNSNVRFISIDDHYDSIDQNTPNNEVLPFKLLINDQYCADISRKTRSSLQAKRNNGDFVGNYCPYGYKKCEDNHNKVEPNEDTEQVVKDIYNWIIEGYSLNAIAKKLNEQGVKTPLDYRLECGEKIQTNFKKNAVSKWSNVTVRRIVENDFYIGTLTQGKTTTPNYKLKQRKTKDQSEWSVVENNHEPLVDKKAFEIAQRILAQDTYTGKDGKLPLFSGMLFCADCGEAMTRTSVKANGKIYFYYMCSSYRCDKSCTSHRISQSKLEDLVLTILKELIYELVNAKEVLETCKGTRSVSYTERRLQKELLRKENELKNASNMISEVYADFKTGLITEDDFIVIKSNFEEKRLAAKNKIDKIKEDLDNLKVLDHTQSEIVKQFEEYKNITALTRKVLLYTIRKIVVCEDNAIEIEFDCQDQLKVLLENAEEMRKAQVV